MFRQAVAEGKVDEFKAVLAKVAQDWRHEPAAQALVSALSGILSGVRDKSVVEDVELSYDHAAEVLLILEEMGEVSESRIGTD
jgi:mRNA-degrading endonuclease YafQ of YafQ-DinJ toxin-antitoxin module